MREHYSVILHSRIRKADLNRSKNLYISELLAVLIDVIIIHVFHIAYTHKKMRAIKNTKLTVTESIIIQKQTKAKYRSLK